MLPYWAPWPIDWAGDLRSSLPMSCESYVPCAGRVVSQELTCRDSFTIGAIIIAASYSVPQMIVGRLILGVGVGAAGVIGPL